MFKKELSKEEIFELARLFKIVVPEGVPTQDVDVMPAEDIDV